MHNQVSGGVAKHPTYHASLWDQEKTGKEYFDELLRVSKNQVVWGGNYFAPFLPASQGWIVWDKKKAEGVQYADAEMAWTSDRMEERRRSNGLVVTRRNGQAARRTD